MVRQERRSGTYRRSGGDRRTLSNSTHKTPERRCGRERRTGKERRRSAWGKDKFNRHNDLSISRRDYLEAGANVFVEIYSNRIEISNPGGLPRGLRKEELGTRSERRNPLQAAEQVTEQVAIMLQAACEPRSLKELQSAIGLKHRPNFINAYLEPLLTTKWLEMTIPDKPRSPKQRYRTTDIGRKVLAQWHKAEISPKT